MHNTHWKSQTPDSIELRESPTVPGPNEKIPYDVSPPHIKELTQVIDKFKYGKTSGPDTVPMEIIKALYGKASLQSFHELLCDWWTNKNMPPELLQA